MSRELFAAISVGIMAAVTAALRFLPFLVFRGKRETPRFVTYLGQVLPYAIMAMLVVFCLKGTDLASKSHGLPELIACAVTVGMHAWRKKTLLSIVCGTVTYMLMIQYVFV